MEHNENKTNYGKIIAVTLAIVAAASAISILIYQLVRRFMTFVKAFKNEIPEEDPTGFDELEEEFLAPLNEEERRQLRNLLEKLLQENEQK